MWKWNWIYAHVSFDSVLFSRIKHLSLTFIVKLNGFNTIFSRGISYKRITRGKHIGSTPVLCKPVKAVHLFNAKQLFNDKFVVYVTFIERWLYRVMNHLHSNGPPCRCGAKETVGGSYESPEGTGWWKGRHISGYITAVPSLSFTGSIMTTNNYVSALSTARHPGITSAAIHPSTNVSLVLAAFADTSCISNALLVDADEMPQLAEIFARDTRSNCATCVHLPMIEINLCDDYRCVRPRGGGITINLLAVVRRVRYLRTRNFRQIIVQPCPHALQRDNHRYGHYEFRTSSQSVTNACIRSPQSTTRDACRCITRAARS